MRFVPNIYKYYRLRKRQVSQLRVFDKLMREMLKKGQVADEARDILPRVVKE